MSFAVRSGRGLARCHRTLAVLILLGACARPAAAQGGGEHIAFSRPESWALKYFAALSTLTPLGSPAAREPWQVELGLELGLIPSLSQSQRRVGFEGTRIEDLNKLPVFARPRVMVALPARFSAEMAWVPPLEVSGVKSNLLAASLERPLVSGVLTLGLRAYGQIGHVKGDFTCPSNVASQPPGAAGNPYGCAQASRDRATLNEAGLALTGGAKIGARGAYHFAGGGTYNDLEFQVDALTFGFHDRTHLLTRGWTGWIAAGAGYQMGARAWLGGEVFYSPLLVRRPPRASSQNDELLNLRFMLRYRLR